MKKLLKASLITLLAVLVVFVGISGYLGYTMTRQERVPLERTPGEIGLAYEDVTFPSEGENLTLHGWLLKGTRDGRVIIMVHGNGNNRDDRGTGTMEIAARLTEHGYSVLMFDLRGCGESDGTMVSGGYYETRDLAGAIAFVKEREFDIIGVMGFSLGAVTSLITAAENKDIDAIVSDSSYADLQDIMEPEFSKRTHAPSFFLKPILFMIKIMFGVDFAAIRPIEGVDKIAPVPIFFIHGDKDETIPVAHANRLYEASRNPSNRLWIVPGAGHVRAYVKQPEEYMAKVTDFFDTELKSDLP